MSHQPPDVPVALTSGARGVDGGPGSYAAPPETWPTGRLISALARRIEHAWNTHLGAWDLNHASLPVLALLVAGPRSQRELATASGVTEQTMSRIVARLERLGYVTRSAGSKDRRRHAVHLTDLGRGTFLEAGDPAVAEDLSTRGLNPSQVAVLRDLLLALLAEPDRPDGTGGPGPGDAHTEPPVETRSEPQRDHT